MGGVDISLPNVSYCEDVKDVHYNPYNTVEFYVGEITSPQTVKIYTDNSTNIPIQVSEGNKWYTYVLPKDKEFYKIVGNSVKKVVIKAYFNTNNNVSIIPYSIVEASFKGSNTSNVTNMSYMFDGCSRLTSLDVSSFDTSNVTYMNNMFKDCTSLTSLDLSSFDTSNVISMDYMFFRCSGLISLNLSNFNTSKVTNMNGMFYGCKSIASLDLSGWDMSKITYMSDMFRGCNALKTIRMVRCTPETRTKIENQLTTDGITGVTILT